ncbi:MAG TPA: diacylglycerol kinase family protein [Casimicrobiaceae bacterium]|nr:diacylglycerol kinase family protein [Casimicrobiaceae bacterium]
MRVTLIYNLVAGDGAQERLRALTELARRAGHDVRARSAHDERLAEFLAEPADVVAVAGGDGTIAAIAQLMQGRDTPIAPLPIGTANNIATALGLADLSFEEQIFGWERARPVRFDVGMARGPWGSRAFIEGFGVGLLSHAMKAPHRHKEPDASMAHARLALREALERLPAVELEASLDGRDCSGRYIAVEAMNIGWIGPNLKLVARADPGDQHLDVVLVSEAQRDVLREGLAAEENGDAWPRELPAVRGRRLEIRHSESGMHIDGEVWPADGCERANGEHINGKRTNGTGRNSERGNGHAQNGEPIEIGLDREGVCFLAADGNRRAA